ncbi:MAG: NAD-dependent epimerase/dehydratase family protein [Candidatus Sulfotelmatobacter sp.]
MNSKRAVVTGGVGFLGSHLCDALLAEGWTVVLLTKSPFGGRTPIPSTMDGGVAL